jgi:predicted enzyme related to lactoylglutathione lyase
VRIKLASVFVDDQARALEFYTRVVGFVKKTEIPLGEFSFLTVASKEAPDVELLLEPNENPAARAFQLSVFAQGIPATAFFSEDLQRDYERMKGLGAVFRQPPTQTPFGMQAVFEDTVGNLIQIHQPVLST